MIFFSQTFFNTYIKNSEKYSLIKLRKPLMLNLLKIINPSLFLVIFLSPIAYVPAQEVLPSAKEQMESYFNKMDQYYEENYFSKGVKVYEMKGTGFNPYVRNRHFYEMRADHLGRMPAKKRWEIYQKSRMATLSRGQLQAANWELMGPQLLTWGGRMISLEFDPVDPNTLYAGSADGGLWRTEDMGENWLPLTDDIPAQGISSIVVNPQNRNSILIGTGEASYPLGPAIRNGIGVLKSYDFAKTWNQTNYVYDYKQGVSTFDMVWDPVDTTNVYLAATDGFWVSRDGGMTWERKIATKSTSIAFNKSNPNIIYTIVEGVGVQKSIDAGETWTILDNGHPTGDVIGICSITICDSQPNVLYTSITDATTWGYPF